MLITIILNTANYSCLLDIYSLILTDNQFQQIIYKEMKNNIVENVHFIALFICILLQAKTNCNIYETAPNCGL